MTVADFAEPVGLVSEDRARAEIYRLLGVLLAAPPDEQTLEVLRGIGDTEGPLAGIWRDLRKAAQNSEQEGLADEYHRLFIGLGRGEVVPYASFYLAGFLMDRLLADLRGDLRRLGFARKVGVAEPEDHAAARCEVMGLLIGENRREFSDRRFFFDRFVGSWFGRFFQDLAVAESADFYRAVSGLGRRFMLIEQAYFDMPE